MFIPPGVRVLVQDIIGEDGKDSPSVQLKELLQGMSDAGISPAGVIPLSETHLIVVGYQSTEPTNDESPPAAQSGQGARKTRRG